MEKVRFSCPQCGTMMQAAADKIDSEVACPQCSYQFKLVDREVPASDAPTLAPRTGFRSDPEETRTPDSTDSWSQPAAGNQRSEPQKYGANPAFTPNASGAFCCPYCQTNRPPKWKSEVSQAGWIVFAVLLVTTCVFCFVGLFIRDRYRVCSQCNVRLE